MKYKPSDKVRIKSLDWYNENKNENGNVRSIIGESFFEEMSKYCGLTAVIKIIVDGEYKIDVDNGKWCWTDDMIEGLVEEEVGLVDNLSSRWVNEFNLPEGYIFKDENGNVINATKIVLEKKEKEYPKTYEECCKVLGVNPNNYLTIRNVYCYDGEEKTIKYEKDLLDKFDYLWQLIICRDAYWKIAGEEMGLGKPWEPDYIDKENTEYSYYIFYDGNNFQKGFGYSNTIHRILMFPFEEMRDAFYENFKELIESCKELL